MISFKKTINEDVDVIYELSKDLILKYEKQGDLEFILNWMYTKIKNHIEEYQVIYQNNVKVGYFRLFIQDEYKELDDFYIFEEFRNHGIGTEVLYRICKETIQLYVFNENIKAIALYERFGFRIIKDLNNGRSIMRLEAKYGKNHYNTNKLSR